ncbi:hypothetical protein [Arthrobacter psychrochitiniphilus]|uniref:hypothetical protein n=1 Tax=Arthrobacter psychrochitiniphilus TaxID=291045 RepID=UPI003F7C3A01
MSQLMKFSGLTLALSLALVGCSASSTTKSSQPTPISAQTLERSTAPATPAAVKPAAGITIEGKGYSYVIPQGWAVPEDTPTPVGIDTFAANMRDTDGFADNVNVVLSPAGEVPAAIVESQGAKELENVGAKDVKVRDRTTIAGSESVHLSSVFPNDQGDYQTEQFYFNHKKQTYILTFSFSPTVSEADRLDVYSSVQATWSWT